MSLSPNSWEIEMSEKKFYRIRMGSLTRFEGKERGFVTYKPTDEDPVELTDEQAKAYGLSLLDQVNLEEETDPGDEDGSKDQTSPRPGRRSRKGS